MRKTTYATTHTTRDGTRRTGCPACGGTGTSNATHTFGVLTCQVCRAVWSDRPVDKDAVKRDVRWDRTRVADVPEEQERDFYLTFTDGGDVRGVFDVVSREVVHYR